jgi:hypothetical protein
VPRRVLVEAAGLAEGDEPVGDEEQQAAESSAAVEGQ